MTRTIDEATVDGLEAALDAVVGAALVLDAELRVIAATPSASAMVGVPVERGTLAPKPATQPAGALTPEQMVEDIKKLMREKAALQAELDALKQVNP